jgi:cyclic pyranopterin phosphate synthase
VRNMTNKTSQPVDMMLRPLHDLRISVTDRCNFRCTYCMPAEIYGIRYQFLPKTDLLTYEEIVRITNLLLQLGVTKIRVTGGEPLLRADVDSLIGQLARNPGVEDIALTTNGYLLADQAQRLKDAGLNRVTVSLDSLTDNTFGLMNGRGHGLQPVLDGIDAAARVGLNPIKINMVVDRNANDKDVLAMARHFKNSHHILRFIEFMDVGNLNEWRKDRVVPSLELVARINAEMPIEPIGQNYIGEVASRYRYVDGSGEIGFISSITHPFCGDCTRIRMSPDGKIFTCLFASTGLDIKESLRSGVADDEIMARLSSLWMGRNDRYSELRASGDVKPTGDKKIEMYQIGG